MELPWSDPMGFHGIYPHEIAMVWLIMVFHGKLAIKSMVTPWNYHGQTPWVSMEFAHMKFHGLAHHDIPWKTGH